MLGLSPSHIMIFGIIAILLFGNRLPTVARSLGRSLTEFKKGMSDLEHEFKSTIYSDTASTSTPATPPRVTYAEQNEPAGPRFEPPKA